MKVTVNNHDLFSLLASFYAGDKGGSIPGDNGELIEFIFDRTRVVNYHPITEQSIQTFIANAGWSE